MLCVVITSAVFFCQHAIKAIRRECCHNAIIITCWSTSIYSSLNHWFLNKTFKYLQQLIAHVFVFVFAERFDILALLIYAYINGMYYPTYQLQRALLYVHRFTSTILAVSSLAAQILTTIYSNYSNTMGSNINPDRF